MGQNGYHVPIAIGQYRFESKSIRRQSILQDCNGNCRQAARLMGQVISARPDYEVERKARADKRYFEALDKVKGQNKEIENGAEL